MSDLEFVRVAEDGRHIIVRDANGNESVLPIDDRLSGAIARPRTLAQSNDDTLTPREIQSRVRAGADVEELAAQTGTPIDRIMAYAVPILQERNHIATRARGAVVRRATGTGTLEEVVVARLLPLGVSMQESEWDARRLDDGRWEVRFRYPSDEGTRTALWAFDPRGAIVNPLDQEAHWLLGEAPAGGELPAVPTRTTLPVFKPGPGADNVVPMRRPRKSAADQDAEETNTEDDQVLSDEPVPLPKRKGRKPVPSWDEILFGTPNDEGE